MLNASFLTVKRLAVFLLFLVHHRSPPGILSGCPRYLSECITQLGGETNVRVMCLGQDENKKTVSGLAEKNIDLWTYKARLIKPS